MKTQIKEKKQVLEAIAKGVNTGDRYFGDGDERFAYNGDVYAYGSTLSPVPGTIQWEVNGGHIYTLNGKVLSQNVVSEFFRLQKQQSDCTQYGLGDRYSTWREYVVSKEEHNNEAAFLESVSGLKLAGLKGPVKYARMWG